MWRADRAGGATLFAVVGADCVECGVLDGGRWLQGSLRDAPFDPVQGISSAVGAPAAALERLAAELRQWHETNADGEGSRIGQAVVLVADVWLAVAGVPWSEALQVPAQGEAFARGQIEAAGHAVEPGDTIRLDDAPHGQPRLAVAYPAPLMAALEALAGSVGARLSSVLPLSVAAWHGFASRDRAASGALAVLDRGMLLVLHGSRRLADVSVRCGSEWADGAPDRGPRVRQAWQRMQLRDAQLASVRELRLLNLSGHAEPAEAAGAGMVGVALPADSADGPAVPSALRLAASRRWPSAIDAMPARPRTTPLRIAISALALAVAAAWTWQAWQRSEQVAALSRQVSALQMERGTVPRAETLSREQTARIQAVNSAIRELNFPAAALLRALQPPPDIQVAVLSVDLPSASSADPSRPSLVKIVAEARTPAAMARYVGFVGERKPFSGAYLTRHEIVDAVPDRPYRFNVEATWTP